MPPWWQCALLHNFHEHCHRAIQDHWMEVGQSFALVFSLTSPKSFYEMEDYIKQILRVKDANHAPMILIG
jgi:hypothetical protein